MFGIKDANVSGALTVAGNSKSVSKTDADAGKSLVADAGSADVVGMRLPVSAGSSSDTGREDAKMSLAA